MPIRHTCRACVHAIRTHLAFNMKGSMPDGEGDAMQKRLGFLPQRRFGLVKIVVRLILP